MISLRTLARLTRGDWARLMEASVLFLCVRVGLRWLPFAELTRRLDRWAVARRGAPDSVSRITWAVSAVARRLPGARCLAEALVASAMLRRHGFAAVLRIGARNAPDAALDAHAWVECEGEIVIGRVPAIHDYAVLT